MSDSQAYEYRAFLLQISEKLTHEDCKKIVFLEDLPVELDGKLAPLTVLTQLEMRDKAKPDDLAKILKAIKRDDLAKKVKDFTKQQKKGRTATSDLQRLAPANATLNANFQITLLQCGILLQQVEKLRKEAEKVGYRRVEEEVAEAHDILADQFQLKLLNAHTSKAIQEEQGFCKSSDGYLSSPDSQLSSLDFEAEATTLAPATSVQQPPGCVRLLRTVNTSELKAAVDNLKPQSTMSLPRSSQGSSPKAQPTGNKQPLMPPSSQRQLIDSNTQAPFHMHSSSLQRTGSPGPQLPNCDAGKHMVKGLEERPRLGVTVDQLVVGKLKPTPPPKPKIKSDQKVKQAMKGEDKGNTATDGHLSGVAPHTSVASQQADTKDDPDYDYLNTCSCTGDSGFADSREFLRVSLSGEYQLPQGAQHPPPGQQQGGNQLDASYCTPMEVKGTAEAQYYKSLQRDAIQEIHYSPPVTSQQYMNIQHKGRK